MGISERKEKQKTEIRKLILDASIKLFLEQGFENVSIRKIADLIEYSPTTIYLYFKDKDEILFELHEIGFRKMSEYNIDLMNIKNPLLRLHKMGENYLRFGIENPGFYDLMFVQKAPMTVLEKTVDCEWKSGDLAFEALKHTIAEAMEKGLIIKGDVEIVAVGIWSNVHGLVALTNSNRIDKLMPAEKIPTLLNSVLNWLVETIDVSMKR